MKHESIFRVTKSARVWLRLWERFFLVVNKMGNKKEKVEIVEARATEVLVIERRGEDKFVILRKCDYAKP